MGLFLSGPPQSHVLDVFHFPTYLESWSPIRHRQFAITSLPLYRTRRFRADIIDHTVHTAYLVYNAARDSRKQIVRELRPIRRHPIKTVDRTKSDNIFVRPLIAHDADGMYGQEHSQCLPERIIRACNPDFFEKDLIRFTKEIEFFQCHIADDANSKPRTRKRMTIDKFFG